MNGELIAVVASIAFSLWVVGRDIYKIATIGKRTRLQRRQLFRDLRAQLLSVLVSISLIAALKFLFWYQSHSDVVLNPAVRVLGSSNARFLTGFIVLAVGGLASLYKRRDQYRYGWIEVGFGTVTAWVASAYVQPGNFFTSLATLGGCIYVVSRGFNNVSDGSTKETEARRRRESQEAFDTIYERPK